MGSQEFCQPVVLLNGVLDRPQLLRHGVSFLLERGDADGTEDLDLRARGARCCAAGGVDQRTVGAEAQVQRILAGDQRGERGAFCFTGATILK